MGTNYYMRWTPPGATGFTLETHICKSLCMFEGSMFGTWRDWRTFLAYNVERISVEDEYGVAHRVDEFIEQVNAIPLERRSRQANYVLAHYPPDGRDWLDPDGFSFHRGEFS